MPRKKKETAATVKKEVIVKDYCENSIINFFVNNSQSAM